jgi:glycolate oxidase iron-sulfur subunit
VTLPVDHDELAACVSCGLCLPHCPTFRVTGEEALSPRGRIAAMRIIDGGGQIDETFEHIVQTCILCRACETACPSSVPFGRLMEGTRQVLASRSAPVWQRAAYQVLARPRLLGTLTSIGALAQRARLVPPALSRRLALPKLPFREVPLSPTGDDVWLFTGCVMNAWQRPVHRASIQVLQSIGVGVALPGSGAACCGALHVHAGLQGDAVRLARRCIAALPGPAPVLVDSAGCGAALKDFAHLLGREGEEFSSRVFDIQEWIAGRVEDLPPPVTDEELRIAIQDPCHLRHVQRAESPVRAVLQRYGEIVELGDEGRCCGAGGAYSALHPDLAGAVRTQKLAVIAVAEADIVASANPGCAMWLSAAGVPVSHPMEIVAQRAGLVTATS